MGWDPPRLRWTAASSKNAAEDRNAADRRTCIAALGGIVGVATMATVKVLRQSSVAFCAPSTSAASLPPASVAADSSQDAGRSCASRQRGGAGLRLAGNKVRQTSACQRQGRSGTATFARRATTFLDHRLRKARRSIGIKPIIARPAIVGGMKSVDMPLTRLQSAIPRGDDLDKSILKIGLPSIANLLIFPFVSAVDTFWVGRMGDPLALAGQGAANQVFSSVFWVIAFLPSFLQLVALTLGNNRCGLRSAVHAMLVLWGQLRVVCPEFGMTPTRVWKHFVAEDTQKENVFCTQGTVQRAPVQRAAARPEWQHNARCTAWYGDDPYFCGPLISVAPLSVERGWGRPT